MRWRSGILILPYGSTPDHPRILALKAIAHLNQAMFNLAPRGELEAAERIINRINERGASSWEFWLADACIKQYLYWAWDQAMASHEKAISLSRGEAQYSELVCDFTRVPRQHMRGDHHSPDGNRTFCS